MEKNMITSDSGEMLVQMWLSFKPYIDKKERADAALAFLQAAGDFVDLETAREEASDADTILASAFAAILGEDEEDEVEDDEDY
jgi:hypothetical protein